ncbi:MAG: lycopene cyclase domain-containing protein [Actinomycetes bacterium]
MTYTQLALLAIVAVVFVDVAVLRTRILARKAFWVSYAIIVLFQLVTNGVLTGFSIVRYSADDIVGSDQVKFVGDGRIAFAPLEDLLFGFVVVVLTLSLWVWWGRRGVQYEPLAGPPRWRSDGSAES